MVGARMMTMVDLLTPPLPAVPAPPAVPDVDELTAFVVAAKAATYAGDGAKLLPYRLGSHDLQFTQGPWAYHDSYVGGTDFQGQEVVYRDGEPVWAMSYYGYLVDPEALDAATAGQVIKRALTALYAQGRFLGGWRTEALGYDYVDVTAGDVGRFTGWERIERAGRMLYELRYLGGRILA